MQSRTKEQILIEMLEYAQNIGLLGVSTDTLEKIKTGQITQNQYILDLSTHSLILGQQEALIEEISNNIDPSLATGEALDIHGRMHNLPRITASPAIVDITVSTEAVSSENIVIPAGTLLIVEEVVQVGDYITSEDIIIPAGVSSASGRAESVAYGVQSPVPEGAIVGLVGYPSLTVTNTEGSEGRNIEDDDDYRLRIMEWSSIHERGTEDCIRSYLDSYEGLNSYNLKPLVSGIGSLEVVCDAPQSIINSLPADMKKHCIGYGDLTPVCTGVSYVNENIYFDITPGHNASLSKDELTALIISQTQTYINGGTNRNGQKIKGLNIGEPFIPSQCVHYLLGEIPEVLDIECGTGYIEVNYNQKLRPERIEVGVNG